MDPKEFHEHLAHFQCQKCSECCKKPGFVYLQKGEEDAMAKLLGMTSFDFVNTHCELIDRQKLVLKKNSDESCFFLREYGCLVHAAKPTQCRDFPIRWRTESSFDYCKGLKKLFPNGVKDGHEI